MQNTFKLTIAAIAALSACLVATPAMAQPAYSPVTITTPSALAPSAATNVASTLYVGKAVQYVPLQITCGLSNAVSTVIGLAFTRSVDGSSYSSSATPDIVIVSLGSAAGTITPVVTNLPATLVQGIAYLKLAYITNYAAAGGTPTNFVLRAGIKSQ